MVTARDAGDVDMKATAFSRAVADLQKAVNLAEEAVGKGRGVGSEPMELAVALEEDVVRVAGLLTEAKQLALQYPAKEPSAVAE